MITNNQRMILFLVGCIGLRITLAVYAKYTQYLRQLGYLALLPAIGFMYIYLSGSRMVAPEAGGKVWWNDLRPVHSIMYFAFAICAIQKYRFAWVFLAIDVIIGLSAYMYRNR